MNRSNTYHSNQLSESIGCFYRYFAQNLLFVQLKKKIVALISRNGEMCNEKNNTLHLENLSSSYLWHLKTLQGTKRDSTSLWEIQRIDTIKEWIRTITKNAESAQIFKWHFYKEYHILKFLISFKFLDVIILLSDVSECIGSTYNCTTYVLGAHSCEKRNTNWNHIIYLKL